MTDREEEAVHFFLLTSSDLCLRRLLRRQHGALLKLFCSISILLPSSSGLMGFVFKTLRSLLLLLRCGATPRQLSGCLFFPRRQRVAAAPPAAPLRPRPRARGCGGGRRRRQMTS